MVGNTAEASGGCQPKHQPTAGPKVGVGRRGAKRTEEGWLCVSGTQSLEQGSLFQDPHRRLFSALFSALISHAPYC